MNKEIKDRLDKLENELKESKNEIHSLKSSVSLTIERGIGKLLSRFTRKQLILGSVIALFLISIIGIAGTVTKTYTFSSGDVVSASKINTNFDNLYTLVNGNLDDNNISGISGSKITSGTVAAARLDNLSGSMITSGTVAAARIDNLDGSKITSGTIAAARIDNLSASKITGVLDNSTLPKPADSIVLYTTLHGQISNGNLGGRSGADQLCRESRDKSVMYLINNSCSNVRALISISSSDQIKDFVSLYNVPTNKHVRNDLGRFITDNFSNLLTFSGDSLPLGLIGITFTGQMVFTGSDVDGTSNSENCSGYTSTSGNSRVATLNTGFLGGTNTSCNGTAPIMCICY